LPGAVSVIIPTTCQLSRADSLWRAIDSVEQGQGVTVEIVAVVNGGSFDPATFERLKNRRGVRTEYLEEGNVSAATRHGRAIAQTPYIAFLDDDDVYLPGALCTRLEALERFGVDFVMTTGFHTGGRPIGIDALEVNQDPLAALARANWISSAGGLYRAERVGLEFFDGRTRHSEWTLLGFKLLAAGRTVRFLDVPTFCLSDTPQSASKQRKENFSDVLRVGDYLLQHAPPRVRPLFRRQQSNQLHQASEYHLERGELGPAWKYHLRSLRLGGLRFLPFTRRLLYRGARPHSA
jgi:hypothetical protein